MGLFEHWPYVNFHDLNLDWIIKEIPKVFAAKDEAQASAEASAESAEASQLSADASQQSADASHQSADSSRESAENAAESEASAKNYADHIADPVAGLVTDWLNDHVTPTTPIVDDTLTISGAAADAKKTGDEITALKSATNIKAPLYGSHNRINPNTIESGIINTTGAIISSDEWIHTDYIEVTPGETLYINGNSPTNYCAYDINMRIITVSGNLSSPYVVPANVKYIKATIYNAEIGTTAYISDVDYYTAFQSIYQYAHSLHENFDSHLDETISLADFSVLGLINAESGEIVTNTDYRTTDFVPLDGVLFPLHIHVKTFNTIAVYALYDANKVFMSAVAGSNTSLTIEDVTVPPELLNGASYIRVSSAITGNFTPYAQATRIFENKMHGKVVAVNNVTFAEHDPSTNMIQTNTLVANRYVSGEDGTLRTSNGLYATDYIKLEPNKQYYFNSNYVYRGYCAFFDANKNYISGVNAATPTDFLPSPFTTPDGTVYGRFTIVSQAAITNAWLCETNQMTVKPDNYSLQIEHKLINEKPTDYSGNEINVFTKILCIGDSLTDGFFNESGGSRLIMRNRSYPAKLQTLTDIECTNLGYAGYTSEEWYAAYENSDLSGHDACIIQLGVNDQLRNVSESAMNTALSNIIAKVKTENNGIKIFVATIIPANSYMTSGMRSRAQMIRDFVTNLNDPNVYLVDLWTYGHTNDYLAYDAGHLSALGYLKLAEDYKAYISYIIHENPNDFRYVQFIGTNYTFSGETTTRQITY